MKIEDFEVYDADKEINLKLKSEHIIKGKEHTPRGCAIALSAKGLGSIVDAKVTDNFAYIRFRSDPGIWRRFALPRESLDFVNAFDHNPKTKDPQIAALLARTICLKPVPESKRLGYRSGSSGTNVRGTNKQKKGVHRAKSLRTMNFLAEKRGL